jgi:hypothetical protein
MPGFAGHGNGGTVHTIIVTKATIDLLHEHAPAGMREGARQADGVYAIAVDDEVYERLCLIDENVDVAIRKACSGQFGNS